MKLDDFTPELLQQAVESYLAIAYPKGIPPALSIPDFTAADSVRDIVGTLFRNESHTFGAICCNRFSLRLGNERYPNMKLMVQEFMELGQYFFAVDAHDQLPIGRDSPGYEEWQQLRDFNAWIKHCIEKRWQYLGLPTLAAIVKTIESRPATTTRLIRPKRILVVDDDLDVANAVERVLEQKGFVVWRCHSGTEAMSRVREARPDLIVMDFMMPGMTGGEVLKRLKSDPATAKIPVLLATTTPVELIGEHSADGFLVKPFPRQILMQMVMHLLRLHESGSSQTTPLTESTS